MQWAKYEDPCPLTLLLETLLRCKARLRRLVVYQEEKESLEDRLLQGWISAGLPSAPLQADFFFTFARRMEHLVALCLSINISATIVKELEMKFIQEILPDRPSFWFHVGPSLPRPNDFRVPRVHYDEIISPINYFDVPPVFY